MEDLTDLELGGARRRLRVLVVDDEPLGRRRIQDLLEEQPDVEVIGTAADGVSAIEAIRTGCPDLVFLDVQMPRMSGLEVVQAVGPAEMPATVFVTAHDHYALNAFDAAAVDYLVKPFKDDRFVEAVRRARRHIDLAGRERLHEHLLALLHGGATPVTVPPPPVESPRRLERIAVRMSGKTRVVPVRRIDYITADGLMRNCTSGPIGTSSASRCTTSRISSTRNSSYASTARSSFRWIASRRCCAARGASITSS
jgi:two-component system, LytTR family, response regulator